MGVTQLRLSSQMFQLKNVFLRKDTSTSNFPQLHVRAHYVTVLQMDPSSSFFLACCSDRVCLGVQKLSALINFLHPSLSVCLCILYCSAKQKFLWRI